MRSSISYSYPIAYSGIIFAEEVKFYYSDGGLEMKEKCVAVIRMFLVICIFLLCMSPGAWSEEGVSKYDRARALYNEGPSKAPEIIALLKEELAVNPENDKAIRLLGITYFGVGQSEKAIEQFDASIDLAAKKGSIVPGMLFYKARALHDLGRNAEARKILDTYWAFFQDGGDLQRQYEIIYPQIVKELEGK
jgi:tetratricopeptide (TPR) repeat protein